MLQNNSEDRRIQVNLSGSLQSQFLRILKYLPESRHLIGTKHFTLLALVQHCSDHSKNLSLWGGNLVKIEVVKG
jgi:hypothetical protein